MGNFYRDVQFVMSKRRAEQLLAITGHNFSEIEPPAGGWTSLYTSCVLRSDEELGKFFIVKYGNIDYVSKGYTMANVRNFHPALMDLGIKQLEDKCAAILKSRAEATKFPNIYHLLMKFHGLYY